ncbi:RteC domain-containing protein [Wenyingzhuangia sp. chi5]|uniref:RteC domain-containing protein n=1 Tax=Wenyingzhuangia gilva TaxID=3057677 RepID=A0ABT8VSK1_9FLAO|nr:RteC domain-containing protein [Wenyingzhuangia sp. chi5]MDO3694915.1 RteC domain-containing protein [Wenyingzhuangia sp. chi5]
MKRILDLVKNYENTIKKIESKHLKKEDELKLKLKEAKKHLHQIRVYVRTLSFKNTQEEINFFKNIKPSICGEIKFLKLQMSYKTEKPFVSVEKQKKYIHRELRRLESKKKKNINFYRYIKQGQTALDKMYFVRGNEQLALFSQTDYPDIDPEFTTSHDLLASEVVTYHLLSNYFKQELHCLSNLEAGCYDTLSNNLMKNNFTWTASKTDLVELIYALKVTGAINGGDTQIKEITEVFGQLFNVDLGNYYKTFGEIKNRQNNQAKFLSNLSLNLISKLEIDDF